MVTLTIPCVDGLGARGVKQRVPTETSLPLAINTSVGEIDANLLNSNNIHLKARDSMDEVFVFRILGVDRETAELT